MFFKSDGRGRTSGDKSIPLVPLRDIIIFPHMVSQLFVGREKSIAALDEAMSRDKSKEIFLAAQRHAKTNEPGFDDIFTVGAVGVIMQLLRLPDGTVRVTVEGRRRARIKRFVQADPFFAVDWEEIPEVVEQGVEIEALMRSVASTFGEYGKLNNKKIGPELVVSVQAIDDPARLSDTVIANLPTVKLSDRQGLLETPDARARLERLMELMQAEIEILQVERKIRSRVKKQMEKTQKEYYLNEQMQAIQKELGGGERDEFKNEIQEVEATLKNKRMSEEAAQKVRKELKKLKMMHPTSAEATVVRNYIDWILELPWYDKTEERFDLKEAEAILEEDHYGLKKIKERILEYLAVQALTKKLKGPVLCFVGPPGVGKTSLGKSIARATGRKFVRLALGGVRDEAEIRGHRRTYIGALPGKIVQSLKKVGAGNPVFLLDEVDKMSSDFRGDPAAALLEVLDPEQNHAFNDHYLDLDYDLSDVMFITTANSLSGIPVPLQDRMEIIQLSGYTEFEKLNIAQKYLVPRQRHDCGLDDVEVDMSEGAIRTIIHHYTKESGVRSLEREIASVCRKLARRVVEEGKDQRIEVTARAIPKLLGVPKYRVGKAEEKSEVGLVNGLAVTSVGGDLLPAEATVFPGKGKVTITGLVEKGMEESGQAAMSYVRARLERLGLPEDIHQKVDVHVHFPDFVKKDGPSAGVTIVTAIVSALLKAPVRHDLAMTGEITLRGRVLPIGGVKEKLLAAHRSRIATVLLPKENRKDLRDVPRRVLASLRLVLVDHIDDVLREALIVDDPDKLFGPTHGVVEYRGGELYAEPAQAPAAPQPAPGGTPEPAPDGRPAAE
ncbi:MAG: endopeptidase La [Myxococcales bacterium]|nr:endopeptidase La [Myxococcales bacterium]